MNTINIKKMIVLSAALMLLAACASQSAYRAADGRGFGYSERQLSEDQYRVHFRGRGNDTGIAVDYAMLRASELTLEKGYDWFDVANRDTLVDRETVVPATAIGVGYSSYRPSPLFHTNLSLGDQRREVEVIMDVRMGKGIRPDNQLSYDARELYARLKPDA